jgi:sorbose reductase
MFEVNTFGAYYFARALARSWMGLPVGVDDTSVSGAAGIRPPTKLGKQILFISSISGLVAMHPQRQTAYNASKGALTMLSKVRHTLLCTRHANAFQSLAAEWAPMGISVNSISPVGLKTGLC